MLRNGLVVIAALALVPTAANAQAFSDNFNGENGGLTALQYNGFANFTATGGVDIVRSPDYGIVCAGSCVDLDGTRGPGSITSIPIAYFAGQRLVISFDAGGSQRSSASDLFNFSADYGQAIDQLDTVLSGFAYGTGGNLFGVTGTGTYSESIAGTSPFKTYSFAFTPSLSGNLTLTFGTTSADNVGPLLDNVSVLAAAVPEPATWAMMIAGFGLAGAALRRRKTTTSVRYA